MWGDIASWFDNRYIEILFLWFFFIYFFILVYFSFSFYILHHQDRLNHFAVSFQTKNLSKCVFQFQDHKRIRGKVIFFLNLFLFPENFNTERKNGHLGWSECRNCFVLPIYLLYLLISAIPSTTGWLFGLIFSFMGSSFSFLFSRYRRDRLAHCRASWVVAVTASPGLLSNEVRFVASFLAVEIEPRFIFFLSLSLSLSIIESTYRPAVEGRSWAARAGRRRWPDRCIRTTRFHHETFGFCFFPDRQVSRHEEAEQLFRQAQRLAPADPSVYMLTGKTPQKIVIFFYFWWDCKTR